MNTLDMKDVVKYVNDHITAFHDARLKTIQNLGLANLLKKNPYLYRAKNLIKAADLIEDTMQAFLSSSEEKIFGDFLEELAIFIASKTVDGHKSASQGLDLEFSKDGLYYIVSVKSGPNWGNSSQHKKLQQDFHDAGRRLRQSSARINVQPTLGICYGKTKTVYHKYGYLKVVGQNFWALISDNKDLYKEIIEPIGHDAKKHNDSYNNEKGRITNILTRQFIDEFCTQDGVIDWNKVVERNSKNYDLDVTLQHD